MDQIFRSATIQIGQIGSEGLQISGKRTNFTIKKTSTSEPNTAKVSIYNLSLPTRNKISVSGEGAVQSEYQISKDLLIVKAGYSGSERVVFMGNITLTNSKIVRPEVITNIEASDGIAVSQFKYSQSFSANVSAKHVLQDIVSKSAFAKNAIKWSSLPDKKYKQGFVYHGDASVALSNVCNYIGLEWSIQNNELLLIPIGNNDGIQVALISPDNGMIGSPEELSNIINSVFEEKDTRLKKIVITDAAGNQVKKKRIVGGLKVTCLLRPEINPGNVVEIESEEISKSLFRVVEVTHTGDTHDLDWKSELVLRAI